MEHILADERCLTPCSFADTTPIHSWRVRAGKADVWNSHKEQLTAGSLGTAPSGPHWRPYHDAYFRMQWALLSTFFKSIVFFCLHTYNEPGYEQLWATKTLQFRALSEQILAPSGACDDDSWRPWWLICFPKKQIIDQRSARSARDQDLPPVLRWNQFSSQLRLHMFDDRSIY